MSDRTDETDSVLRRIAAAPPKPLSPSSAPTGLKHGVLLVDRYQILDELGRGGMGCVFSARDLKLGRDVAIKVLLGEQRDPSALRRFEQEARAASRINHPNIATVYDVIATEDGPAIVTELLDGATLRDHLQACGTCSVDEVRALGLQLAEGLAAAHEAGVIHRDLKPANLFVTRDGRLKILDFGVAKLVEPDANAAATQEGFAPGTLGYMSPEQVRAAPIDARSDIFAVGIVLYEMLTGRRPFEGSSRYEIESRIVERDPDPVPPSVPRSVAAIVMRCLEKTRDRRFQSARELGDALAVGRAPAPSGRAIRMRVLRWALLAGSLVAVSIAGYAALRRGYWSRTHESSAQGTRDPEAYDYYLLARRQEADGSRAAFIRARASIERALARDPSFALAWSEYSKILFGTAFEDVDREKASTLLHSAMDAANKAIALDPNSAHGYVRRSFIRSDGGAWDVSGARADLEHAERLSPNDVEVVRAKAHFYLYFTLDDSEAIAVHERAVKLDPLSSGTWFQLGRSYRRARRFPEAIAAFTRSEEIAPGGKSLRYLAEFELHAGHFEKALALYDRMDRFEVFRLMGHAMVFDAMGRHSEARKVIADLEAKYRDDGPFWVGYAYAMVGDVDNAFKYFQRAASNHEVSIVELYSSPFLQSLHQDPRYAEILRTLGIVEGASTPKASVAVLPFHDLSPAHDQQFLSDGIAEDVLTSLARVDGLRVAGRTSSFSFRDTKDDARTIGQKLGVGALLEGSVRRAGERVRISARLVSAADGYQLWAQDFDRGSAEILAVEDELARDIVAALKVKLIPGNRSTATDHGSKNPEAYNDYLLARRQALNPNRPELEEARRSIERAIRRDPQFAAAWAEYAQILFSIGGTADVNRAAWGPLIREAAKAADKAIAIDPDLPDGYVIRSSIRSDGGAWDLQGARADVERALALSPNDAPTLMSKAHLLLYFSRRLDEAIETLKRVTELEPLDAGAWYLLGYAYRNRRRFAEAKTALTRSLQIWPQNTGAQYMLAELELHEGRVVKALAMFDAIQPPSDPFRMAGRVLALDALHHRAESRAALVEMVKAMGEENPLFVGNTYAGLGDVDRAFFYYERAFAHHDVALIDIVASPFIDNVRRDPRYAALIHRMKLIDDDSP